MKLLFKRQKVQADAAKAVCDVFAGQPFLTSSYMIDKGHTEYVQRTLFEDKDFTGFGNARIVPGLNEQVILEQIQKIQRIYQIEPSKALEGRHSASVSTSNDDRKSLSQDLSPSSLQERWRLTLYEAD
jgi:type III restriction enzyme